MALKILNGFINDSSFKSFDDFNRDNSRVVSNSKESKSHARAKQIERKYHVIKDIIDQGEVIVYKTISKIT